MKIVESSPKAKEKIETTEDEFGTCKQVSKYPFECLEIGQSFAVPTVDIKENSMRSLVSKRNNSGKKFIVVKHTESGVFEIARVR